MWVVSFWILSQRQSLKVQIYPNMPNKNVTMWHDRDIWSSLANGLRNLRFFHALTMFHSPADLIVPWQPNEHKLCFSNAQVVGHWQPPVLWGTKRCLCVPVKLVLRVLNAGNGWEWGNGMILHGYYGSFPHSRSEAPVSSFLQILALAFGVSCTI